MTFPLIKNTEKNNLLLIVYLCNNKLDVNMKTKAEYITLLKQFKEHAANKYGILRIGIFGSVARGEQTDNSDLDVCIEVQNPDAFILADIRDELERLCNCKIDLLRLRKGLSNFLMQNIEKDGIFA